MSHVLIVDDEESICWALRRLLTEAGHSVAVASSAEDAFEHVARQAPALVLLDVRLPGMDGLEALARLRGLLPATPVVIMTAYGSLSTAVAALSRGAFEYLIKPFDLDAAAAVVARALERPAELASSGAGAETPPAGEELLGTSAPMQEVFKRIALVAPTEASVLVTGESGTGKELVARAIHRHSLRAEAPLVPVNLAALSPTLVESELFGHARGAFTGAATARQGLLELADGGTVFFDEAGDIPASVQVKLLRVLEQHEVTPVGDTRPRTSAFRVIAATNRDLRSEVGRGAFREDLYFRLAVFEIALPSLRERPDDIPLLANCFLVRARGPGSHARFTRAAMDELCRRPWPGNVRELRNAVEHAVIVARGGPIGPEHLPAPTVVAGEQTDAGVIAGFVRRWAESQFRGDQETADLYERLLDLVEPPLLEVALRTHHGQRVSAARSLGLHRATLRKKLERMKESS
ncbi:MAG: sigma-54-dependent Fis family transcriptional regulator [Planctomycetia bacterium]|nr:sigma-54-dependent Fis family transcriptional regulator [Planctomycetia bacterium]